MKVIVGEGIVDESREKLYKMARKRNFPDFIRAYRKYADHQEATTKMHHWIGIQMLAAVCERRLWFPRGYYRLFPNLYTFIIAPSGYKKSTAANTGMGLLRQIPDIRMMADRLTGAALSQDMSENHTTFVYNGNDIKQAALFGYASELSACLSDVHGPVIEYLTHFYDCSPSDSRTPYVYKTKNSEPLRIFGPCLNLLGCSTPEWLVSKCLTEDHMEGGFTSRVIFVVENTPPVKCIPFPEVDTVREKFGLKLVEDLKQIFSLVGKFDISRKARNFYTRWYGENKKAVHVDRLDPRFSGYYARKPETIIKLAMIASVSRGDSLMLEKKDFLRALAWLKTVEGSMLEAFSGAGRNESARLTRDIYDAIRASGKGLDHVKLLRRFWRDAPGGGKDIGIILSDLEGMHMIVRKVRGEGPVVYAVRPGAPKL